MFDALDAFDAKEKVLFLSLLMLTALLLCLAWLGAVHQPRVDMMPMFVPCPTLSYPCLMAMRCVNPCFISEVQCVAGLRMLQSSFVRKKGGFWRPNAIEAFKKRTLTDFWR